MVFKRPLGEIQAQPTAIETPPCAPDPAHKEQPGFWSEAWHSFKYSGVQSPLNGLAQLADYTQLSDKVLGEKLLPKVQFMEAPQENNSWSGWLGQQIGGAAGITLNFMLPGMARGAGRLMCGGTSLARTAESISIGEKIWGATKTGFAYDFLCKPVMPEEGNFWLSRLRNGTVGGATFGTLTGSTLAAKYGLHKFADNYVSTSLGACLKNEIVSGGISGVASGAPAAVVSSYGHSLLTRGEIPTAKEINDSLLSFTTVGGLMGAGHGLVDGYVAGRKGAGSDLVGDKRSDTLITGNIQRSLGPGVRRFKVAEGNAEQLIESLRRDKAAQGRLVLQEIAPDGSLGSPLETHVQHFGPDSPHGLNEQAIKNSKLFISCHPEKYTNPELQAKHVLPNHKGKISLALESADIAGQRHPVLEVGPEEVMVGKKEKRKVTLADTTMEEELYISYDALSKSAKIDHSDITEQELNLFLSKHTDLQQLTLEMCDNTKELPLQHTPSLQQLTIIGCDNIKELPLQHVPSLQQLTVLGCDNIKELPLQHVPSLQQLTLGGYNNIKELPLQHTPSLQQLEVRGCNNIKQLPLQHTPSLQQLTVVNCNDIKEELPLQHVPSLQQLTVRDCANIKELPLQHTPSLQQLIISGCDNVKQLPLQHTPSLQQLMVSDRANIKELPLQHTPSLQQLTVTRCDNIKQLPLQHVPSLQQLTVRYSDNIMELPLQHTPNLQQLTVHDCHKLKELPLAPQKVLKIFNCSNLTDLPEQFPATLEELVLDHLPKLQNLPQNLPSTLKLTMDGCDLLEANSDMQKALAKHFKVQAVWQGISKDFHSPLAAKDAAFWQHHNDLVNDMKAMGNHSDAQAQRESAANVKITADMLKKAADAIITLVPKNGTCVLLGRDSYPLVPLLRYRGIDARYFLWSRLQIGDKATAELWKQEIPLNSIVIDTGYAGSILNDIKKTDPTIKGYLMSSTGAYPEIPGLQLDRGELVRYIERFPKAIGRVKRISNGGEPVAKMTGRDIEEQVFTPRKSMELTKQLLLELGLPEALAERHKTFNGLRREERLGIGKFFIAKDEGVKDTDLPNFGRVRSFMYRGGQPSQRGLEKLKSLGVETIISLRTGETAAEEAKAAESLGMKFIHLPIDNINGVPTTEQIATFMDAVKDTATNWSRALNDGDKVAKPAIYIHCARGADRTGSMIALSRVALERWTYEQAYKEMQRYHFNNKQTQLAEVVKKQAEEKSQTTTSTTAGNASPLDQILRSNWQERLGSQQQQRLLRDIRIAELLANQHQEPPKCHVGQ